MKKKQKNVMTPNNKKFVKAICFGTVVSLGLIFSSCKKADETPAASVTSRFLYVDSGAVDTVLADYNSSPAQPGDSPVGLGRQGVDQVYVLVENTTTVGARRVDLAPKSEHGERTLFSNNTTALSTNLRSLAIILGGDLLIAKSSAIEKITTGNARITKGANAYVNAPTAPCATSTTLISKSLVLGNGFIVFAHAAVGQNRIGFVKP